MLKNQQKVKNDFGLVTQADHKGREKLRQKQIVERKRRIINCH
jgi:hypothetical protein